MPLEAFIPSHDATVACGSCRLCCTKSIIPLLPEHGDDIANYETQIINGHVALAMKPNGDCVYLGENGCTIHGATRPSVERTTAPSTIAASRVRNAKRQLRWAG